MHTTPSAQVIANAPAAPGVRILSIAMPDAWPFVPGQVAELAAGPGTEGYFAIASAPSETPTPARLAFLVKEGSDSEPLMALLPGDQIRVRGPFGRGFELPRAPADLLFVTAGTAVAAARSAIVEALRDADVDPLRIALVVGVRHVHDLCFADEIAAWHASGVIVRLAVSYGDLDTALPLPRVRGRVQLYLPALVTPESHAFIAGSEELEDDVTRVLIAAGVEPSRIQRNYRSDSRST